MEVIGKGGVQTDFCGKEQIPPSLRSAGLNRSIIMQDIFGNGTTQLENIRSAVASIRNRVIIVVIIVRY